MPDPDRQAQPERCPDDCRRRHFGRAIGAALLALATACAAELGGSSPARPGPLHATWAGDPAADLVALGRVRIALDGYVADSTDSPPRVLFSAGGLRLRASEEWSIADRTLTATLAGPPPPGLAIRVELDPYALRGIGDVAVEVPPPLVFPPIDGARWPQPDTSPTPPAPTFTADVAPILARCGACHGQRDLAPLGYDDLVAVPSQSQPWRDLVARFEPANSVLLRRAVPDFPGVAPMPPAFSDVEPLTVDELRVVERWIRAGAPR